MNKNSLIEARSFCCLSDNCNRWNESTFIIIISHSRDTVFYINLIVWRLFFVALSHSTNFSRLKVLQLENNYDWRFFCLALSLKQKQSYGSQPATTAFSMTSHVFVPISYENAKIESPPTVIPNEPKWMYTFWKTSFQRTQ